MSCEHRSEPPSTFDLYHRRSRITKDRGFNGEWPTPVDKRPDFVLRVQCRCMEPSAAADSQ
jgi:hypothetical protein